MRAKPKTKRTPADLLTVAEAAAEVGFSPRRVYQWIADGAVAKYLPKGQRYGIRVSLRQVRQAANPPVERVR